MEKEINKIKRLLYIAGIIQKKEALLAESIEEYYFIKAVKLDKQRYYLGRNNNENKNN